MFYVLCFGTNFVRLRKIAENLKTIFSTIAKRLMSAPPHVRPKKIWASRPFYCRIRLSSLDIRAVLCDDYRLHRPFCKKFGITRRLRGVPDLKKCSAYLMQFK